MEEGVGSREGGERGRVEGDDKKTVAAKEMIAHRITANSRKGAP